MWCWTNSVQSVLTLKRGLHLRTHIPVNVAPDIPILFQPTHYKNFCRMFKWAHVHDLHRCNRLIRRFYSYCCECVCLGISPAAFVIKLWKYVLAQFPGHIPEFMSENSRWEVMIMNQNSKVAGLKPKQWCWELLGKNVLDDLHEKKNFSYYT